VRFMPSIAKKVTTDLMIDMLRARRDGASHKELQSKYGLSRVTIWSWLSRYEGLDARSYPRVRALEEEIRRLQVQGARLSAHLNASLSVIKHMEPSKRKRAWMLPAIRTKFALDKRTSNKILGVGKDATGSRPQPPPIAHLVAMMKHYLAENPGHGLPTMYQAILRGTPGGIARVRKAYSHAGLTLKQRARKKIPVPDRIRRPMAIQGALDQVWSMDFLHHRLVDGTRFQIFNVIDDFNREAIVSEAMLTTSSSTIVTALTTAATCGRMAKCIRTDNGKEFKGPAYRGWADEQGVRLEYSRPYHCKDNAYIEQFNGILRKEVLNFYEFKSLVEVQRMLDDWRKRYNLSRPNFALGGLSPLQYAYAAGQGRAPVLGGRYSQKSPDYEVAML
jgi:putative transposase